MDLTNDMYLGLSDLKRWYAKGSRQFIEVSGVMGTGVWQMIQNFIEDYDFDPREIIYLSYDQKQVLELASKRYHAYYLPGFLYHYDRIVDFNSLAVFNPSSTQVECKWLKRVRKHIDEKYKLIIVFDSTLLNFKALKDLGTLGLPVILIKDPGLLPAPDSYTYARKANITLRELHPELIKNPITYFANKALTGSKFKYGNYDTVSVVPRKQLNLYNLKSADMNITMTDELANSVNNLYRDKVMHIRTNVNTLNERLIVMEDMHSHKLVNDDEKRIKIYLTKGLVGYITKCYKHAPITRYVPVEFKTEFYHESFTDLSLDRNYLNEVETSSRQLIPDHILKCKYAYALSVPYTRVDHWDKVTLIVEPFTDEEFIFQRMLYTAISRCKASMTIVI